MVHRCVINSVVMWLRMLVGPCWCVYVALLESRLLPSNIQQGPTSSLLPNSATYTHTNKDLLVVYS